MAGRGEGRWWGTAVVALVTVALASACTSGTTADPVEQAGGEQTASTRPKPPGTPVKLSISPGNKAADVAPGDPITVAAVGGRITQVALKNDDGRPVAGTLSPDSTTWQAAEPLGFDRRYTVSAKAEGSDGKPASLTSSFRTITPRLKADLSMNPQDGQTVGVGQPLAFYFDVDIPNKRAAEQAIQITTTPHVTGAFYWFNDSEVHWRPKEYWPSGTKISVRANIYGRNFGGGVFGNEDRVANVTVGKAITAVADGGTHQMTVAIDGKVVRTIPIAMGKPGNETPFGTYVVMSEHTNYTMDSSTYGVPADSPLGYRTHVEIATRMSNSGIFYHSAPWSVGDQGHRNVSHGCINMTTENAAWLQRISQKGDIIVVKNSGGPRLESWDGLGDWQIPWPEWVKGNR